MLYFLWVLFKSILHHIGLFYCFQTGSLWKEDLLTLDGLTAVAIKLPTGIKQGQSVINIFALEMLGQGEKISDAIAVKAV